MEFVIALAVIAFIAFIVWVIIYAEKARKRREEAWRMFQAKTGLSYGEGKPWRVSHFVGVYRETPVAVDFYTTGSGKNSTNWTRATALFRVKMPMGINVTKEGFGSGLAKLFGGQDIQVGDENLDSALRIKADDVQGTRALFRNEQAAAAIRAYIAQSPHDAAVLQDRVSERVVGWMDSLDNLMSTLERAVITVRRVEEALWWRPPPVEQRTGSEGGGLGGGSDVGADAGAGDSAGAGAGAEAAGSGGGGGRGGLGVTRREASSTDEASSLVAKMIADLRGGQSAETGEFTIDRDVAIEKMRKFQLKNPEWCVLELVQAAHLKGAQKIDFEVDGNDTRMRFDGDPFTLEDFDQLYASLLADTLDAQMRARQELAIGLNAAAGMKPKYVKMVSGDGNTGAELEITPGEPDRYGVAAEVIEGTRIHIRGRMWEVFTGRGQRLRELLETRLGYARIPITVDGEAVNWNPRAHSAAGLVDIDEGGVTGYAFLQELDRAVVRWIKDGVLITSETVDDLVPGFTAVVHGEGLRKDLSQQEIVRDQAYRNALSAVRKAEGRALSKLADEVRKGRVRLAENRWIAEVLGAKVLSFGSAEAFRPGGPGEPVASAPVFETADGYLLSVNQVLAVVDRDEPFLHADYSLRALMADPESARAAGMDLDAHPVLKVDWLTPERRRWFLAQVTGGRLRSVSAQLRSLPRNLATVDETMRILVRGR